MSLVHTKEEFEFLPGVVTALKKAARSEYRLFIVTNQSGIGRGIYSEEDLRKLNSWLIKELKSLGIVVEKIYYCPHLPSTGCACRKPGHKLLLDAVSEYQINLSKSWIVGDSWSDISCGREANLQTIKIGKKREKMGPTVLPHYFAKNLTEAVDIILDSNL